MSDEKSSHSKRAALSSIGLRGPRLANCNIPKTLKIPLRLYQLLYQSSRAT